MGFKPSSPLPGVDPGALLPVDQIGHVYDNVRKVAENIDAVNTVADSLEEFSSFPDVVATTAANAAASAASEAAAAGSAAAALASKNSIQNSEASVSADAASALASRNAAAASEANALIYRNTTQSDAAITTAARDTTLGYRNLVESYKNTVSEDAIIVAQNALIASNAAADALASKNAAAASEAAAIAARDISVAARDVTVTAKNIAVAAQLAAEAARDEAIIIAGGDFVMASGDTMTGKLNLKPSDALGAYFNVGYGVDPGATAVNGDMWSTAAGMFVRYGNANRQLVESTSLLAYAPLTGGTFTGAINVPLNAYGVSWNGSAKAASEDAVYDEIEALRGLVVGAMVYKGTWNAATNTPAIPAASNANKGWFYKVATAGTTSVSGINDWGVGDWIVSNGTSWDKIDNTETVSSVAGLSGAINASALRTALSINNVDNTSDANKPVSTAQQTALNLKLDKAGGTLTGDITLSGGTERTITFGPNGGYLYGDAAAMGFFKSGGGHMRFDTTLGRLEVSRLAVNGAEYTLSSDTNAIDALAYIRSDGVMTIGSVIDMHSADNDGTDFKVRFNLTGASSTELAISAPAIYANGNKLATEVFVNAGFMAKGGGTFSGPITVPSSFTIQKEGTEGAQMVFEKGTAMTTGGNVVVDAVSDGLRIYDANGTTFPQFRFDLVTGSIWNPAGFKMADQNWADTRFLALAGGTMTGEFHIRNNTPTMWWRDTDHRPFGIHVNGDMAYFMRGIAADTPTWAQLANGQWPMMLNLGDGTLALGHNLLFYSELISSKGLRIVPDTGFTTYIDNAHVFKNTANVGLAQMGTDGGIPYMTVGGGRVLKQAGARPGGSVTISTAAPSGGADGDIWFKV